MRMLEFLGEGTYGRVWKVSKGGKQYALKNFNRQARCLGVPNLSEMVFCMNFDHPHIIKHHEIICNKDEYSLLMELADTDLHGHVLKTRLDKQTLYVYFLQLCSAVKYLHDANIAHYDIKPNNCLLLDGKVKLCDFGSTRPFSLVEHDTRPTLCPPEIFGLMEPSLVSFPFRQETFSSLKTDIWSLGETLFFLLVGRHLFTNNTTETCKLQMQFSKDARAYLCKYNLEEEEIDLLLLLLQVDVNKRADSVDSILEHKLFSTFTLPAYQALHLPLVSPDTKVVTWLSRMKFSHLHVRATACLFSLLSREKGQHLTAVTCLFLCSKIYSTSLTKAELDDLVCKECTLEEVYKLEKELFLSLQARCIFNIAD